ncbi:MAG: PAS domain S-box protein [Proteobacteria bacterium]|nr:PAS domain S-box protein [Pseudomonadota bacterium]
MASLLAAGFGAFIFLAGLAQAEELTPQEQEYLAQKGVVVFVSETHYPPFEFLGEDGDHTGMSIELARWIATRFGFKTRFIDTSFKQAKEAVLGGRADVLTSIFYSEKRDKIFDFTQVMFQVPASVFVAADRPDIKDINDLNGKTIAMEAGDYAQEFLESKHIKFKVAWAKNFAEATDLVIAGKADAIIGDEQIVLYHIYSNHLTKFIKKVGPPLYIGQNCMGVKQGHHLLQSILDKGISLAKETGTLDRINATWLGVHFKAGEPLILRYLNHCLVGAGILVLLALLVWIWNIRLRGLVARRTLALTRSEATLKAILANSPLGIGLVKNQVLGWHNQAMLTMLGYEPGGLEGKDPGILFQSDEQYRRTRDATGQSLREKGEARVETKLVRKDGAVFDCLAHCALLERHGDDITMIVIAEDISERKRAEDELREIFAMSLDLICIADINTATFLKVNPAFSETLGYSEEELLGTSFLEFVHPDDVEPTAKVIEEKLLKGVKVINFVNRYRRKDGQYIWLDWASHPKIEKGVTFAVARNITEERKAAEARRQSEEQFRLLAEGMTDIIWTTDLYFQTIYVSPSVERMLGFTPEERKRQSLEEMVTPESIQKIQEALVRELALEAEGADPERSIKMEVEYYRKDGSTLWVENVINAVRDAGGEIVGIHGVSRDISERKRAEEELKTQAANFNLIFNSVSNILVLVNDEGRVEKINHKGVAFSGRKEEEILGLLGGQVFNCMNSFDGKGCGQNRICSQCPVRTRVESTFQTQEPHRDEEGRMTFLLGGEETTLDLLISTVMLDMGGAKKVLLAITDITERKRAEENLALSEKKYRLLAENITDVIWTVDKDFKITYASPSVEKLRGFTPGEVVGQGIEKVLSPESLRSVSAIIKETLARIADGERDIPPATMEVEQPRKDGSTVWTEAVVNIVFDDDGNFSHLQGVTRDIRQRRKLEARLRESQKMRAVVSLSAGIAHEFNNILAVIMGYAELVLSDSKASGANAYQLEQIIKAASKASDLVKQILTFSRQVFVEMKPLRLNQEISGAIELLKEIMPKMISIEAELAPGLKMVKGNEDQIEQVLINLATNAQDAMPEGGKLLFKTCNARLDDGFCQLHPSLQPGPYVLMEVSDTGQGMDQHTLDQIFDPFFTTKEVGKGTGLGLSSVLGIVQLHGGHVFCRSRPGQGTTFETYLPALPEDEAPAAPR